MSDWKPYVEAMGKSARQAAAQLTALSGSAKVAALRRIASAIRDQKDALLAANTEDIAAAQKSDLPGAGRAAEAQ